MFNNGDIIKTGSYRPELEWTVLDYENSLLGCLESAGHSGTDDQYKGTVWEDHCWYVPKSYWKHSAPLIQENE